MMSGMISRSFSLICKERGCFHTLWNTRVRGSHWQTSFLTLQVSLPVRAEPKRKKKVDPKREQAMKDRLKRRLKKLERIPPELIPIEDFITSAKFMDETRVREDVKLSFEESEKRALLMKEWSRYKKRQHDAEMKMINLMLDSQQEALEELRLESEELYQEAIKQDKDLIPLEKEGPSHTPPIAGYQAPEGKYNDITKVYTQ